MSRFAPLLAVLLLTAACTAPSADDPLADLGAFRLGHNVVIASKAKAGPGSRSATADEWVQVLRNAVARRFGRYEGDQLYHLGISVEGYELAPPGLPLVLNLKSVLVVNVTVWDDAAGAKLNPEVKQITVFETPSGGSVIVGSGNTRTREEQMAGLAANAVSEIEKWMVERKKEDGWFLSRPGAATEVRIPSALDEQPVATTTE